MTDLVRFPSNRAQRRQVGTAFLAVALAVVIAGLNLWKARVGSGPDPLRPEVVQKFSLYGFSGMLGLIVTWTIAIRAFARAPKGWGVWLLVVHTALTLGMLGWWGRNAFFDSFLANELLATAVAPDGYHVAYCYRFSLLGGLIVYVAGSDEYVMHRAYAVDGNDCVTPCIPKMVWKSEQNVPDLLQPDGTPMKLDNSWERLFDWGPH